MKSSAKKIYKNLLFNVRKSLNSIKKHTKFDWYYNDFNELKRQRGNDNTFELGPMRPILSDKNDDGGVMSGHYFHQDLYVARLIHIAKPEKHLDIGSRMDGFVAHVASFREIEIIDIRPYKNHVKNIRYRQADLMILPPELIDYCDSVSSLHAIEHFGLGRYGDPIDYSGYLKAINNITKILKSGGVFYFSVPIGPQRIEFNAHRVFSLKYLSELLSQNYTVHSFSFVDDKGDFFENVMLTNENISTNCGCYYGCGIFTCIKK